MEGAVGDTEVRLEVVSMRILLVALENGQSSHEISLFEEVSNVWQLILLLLKILV